LRFATRCATEIDRSGAMGVQCCGSLYSSTGRSTNVTTLIQVLSAKKLKTMAHIHAANIVI
jgi:hypothetical protein